jgi:hypothetical protein
MVIAKRCQKGSTSFIGASIVPLQAGMHRASRGTLVFVSTTHAPTRSYDLPTLPWLQSQVKDNVNSYPSSV